MTEVSGGEFRRRALTASALLAGVFALFAAFWYTAWVLAPMFVGALFGIFLSELSGRVGRLTGLRGRWAVTLTLILLVAALGLASYALGRRVSDELSRMLELLRQGTEAGRRWISLHPQLRANLHKLLSGGAGGGAAGGGAVAQAVKGAGSMFARALALGVAAFVAFFTGVFLAYSPEFYGDALISLIPQRHRPRWRRLLSELWRSLWLWSLGRLMVMAAIALAHIAAYWLLGVPLPVALGLLAGALAFIPYAGPILAAVPAGLIALTVSPQLLLWVLVVHAAVQTAESHLLTPLTQKYMVDVPALGTIAAFLVFGEMLGLAGVIVAAPLSAALIVIVRNLYVEGTLGETRLSQQSAQ